MCRAALLLSLLTLATPSALLLSPLRSTPRACVVCSAHSRRKRAPQSNEEFPALVQGEGVHLSLADDGLPLPTCVVAFDQEPASGTQPVRLVIVSDTHGFEQSMTNSTAAGSPDAADAAATAALPSGDVLIHCGDFAPGPIWPDGQHVSESEAQVRDRSRARAERGQASPRTSHPRWTS